MKILLRLLFRTEKVAEKLLFDDSMILKGWMNTNTGEQKLAEFNKGFRSIAFSGIHCINSLIFDKIKRTGKFSIMEEYLDFMMTERINGLPSRCISCRCWKTGEYSVGRRIF